MQLNQQGQILGTRNLINSNLVPGYDNSSPSKKSNELQSNAIKSPPTSPRTISPLSQMMQIKNIKNDQFLFRMKLKFIACMQQLEISKEEIEALRKQQSDSQVLSAFITSIKKEFAILKKLKDEYLLKQSNSHSTMKSTNNIQSLEIISLQSQLQQASESQKKLKQRCQRLFTENAQLVEKLKKKQHEYEESENTLYQTKLLVKEYESVIENLKISAKKIEKDFLGEKDRFNEELNAFKQLMVRQRQAKQIYLSKLDNLQSIVLQKDDKIKRQAQQADFLKKECIKWKNRSEWRQGQANQQTRMNSQKLRFFEQQIQKLRDTIRAKESQIALAKKQAVGSTQLFNKKLEKIVEEWKAKLIETIEEYEGTIESYSAKLEHAEKEVQRISGIEKTLGKMSVRDRELVLELSSAKSALNEKDQRVTSLQGQLKESLTFYTQKIRQLQSIITQLKSQNVSKSLSIDQSMSSLSELSNQVKERQTENDRLRNQLINKENELRKINQAKIDAENQLLKRITAVQNNRIIQISKLKVQYQESLKNLQKQFKRVKSQLQKYQDNQIRVIPKTHNTKQSAQTLEPTTLLQQDINVKSSIPSVNNSFNMGPGSDKANDHTDKVISETYVEPQRKSSVRRIFVRSNSINEYLKEKIGNQGNDQPKDQLSCNLQTQTFPLSSNKSQQSTSSNQAL